MWNKKDFPKYCAFNLAPKRYEDLITSLPDAARLHIAFTITCLSEPLMPIFLSFWKKRKEYGYKSSGALQNSLEIKSLYIYFEDFSKFLLGIYVYWISMTFITLNIKRVRIFSSHVISNFYLSIISIANEWICFCGKHAFRVIPLLLASLGLKSNQFV